MSQVLCRLTLLSQNHFSGSRSMFRVYRCLILVSQTGNHAWACYADLHRVGKQTLMWWQICTVRPVVNAISSFCRKSRNSNVNILVRSLINVRLFESIVQSEIEKEYFLLGFLFLGNDGSSHFCFLNFTLCLPVERHI